MADAQPRTIYIPRDVDFFCSLDWGYNAPGVCLWWAMLPDHHYHIVREMKFQQESAEVVAKRWRSMNQLLQIKSVRYVAADPSMWAKTGHGRGESIAETLRRFGLPMIKGDNDRKNGWQRCHELLRLAPDGTPWLTIDTECRYGLRTIPSQAAEKNDPDDVDTGGDDHWVDAFRYGAMSRPMPSSKSKSVGRFKPGTLGALKEHFAMSERRGVLSFGRSRL